jgi:hypothetical protein
MEKTRELPEFTSEQEEAEWWDAHAEETDGLMAEAIANGTAVNLHEFLRQEGLLVDTESATVEVLRADAERARGLAAKKGMSYEAYLASLLREGIAREG